MEQKAAPAAGIGCGGWAGAEDWEGGGAGFCHLNTSSALSMAGPYFIWIEGPPKKYRRPPPVHLPNPRPTYLVLPTCRLLFLGFLFSAFLGFSR
jgi:hypothetical protein